MKKTKRVKQYMILNQQQL